MSCSQKNHHNYKQLQHTWNNLEKENYFVSYAVRGPMVVPSYGLRQGMPVDHPICGPVSEPSPLNNRYKYSPQEPPPSSIL